jgi:hypothetical protein
VIDLRRGKERVIQVIAAEGRLVERGGAQRAATLAGAGPAGDDRHGNSQQSNKR